MSEEIIDQENAGIEGSSSSEVKPDVKPEIPTHDEKNVPYYNRYREMEEKFKGVDLDFYNRAKEMNLDELEQAYQELQELKAQQAGKGQAPKQGQLTPEMQAIMQKVDAITAHIQQQNQSSWMKEYRSSVDSSLAESLKSEDFKDLGGKLTDFEKRAVMKFVDDTFEADAAKGKGSKLSIKDAPGIVQEMMKMVLDNRKGMLGGMIKKDSSPQPIGGQGGTGEKKKGPMTDAERLESQIEFLKQQKANEMATV